MKKNKKNHRKVMDMSAQLNISFNYNGVEFKREIGITRCDPNDPKERKELNQVFDKTITKLLIWANLNEAYISQMKKLQSNSDVL